MSFALLGLLNRSVGRCHRHENEPLARPVHSQHQNPEELLGRPWPLSLERTSYRLVIRPRWVCMTGATCGRFEKLPFREQPLSLAGPIPTVRHISAMGSTPDEEAPQRADPGSHRGTKPEGSAGLCGHTPFWIRLPRSYP